MRLLLSFALALALAVPAVAQDYCELSCQCDEYISRVELDSIDNTSTYTDCYSDHTDISTTLYPYLKYYQITVTVGSAYSLDSGAAWIDWNRNFDFEESERILLAGGYGPYVGQFRIPYGVPGGETRLRVRLCYNQTPCPCGDCTYGEVEDYTIYIGPVALKCGDADGNSLWGISDAVYVIAFIFGGAPPPNPYLLGDCDGNCIVNISDVVYMVHYVFGGGPEPHCSATICP